MNLDWCAGFFDGEGTVGLWKNGKHKRLTAAVYQKDRASLDLFCSVVGGIGKVRGPYTSQGRFKGFLWNAAGGEVIEVFNLLNGRLFVKQEQFLNAVRSFHEYQATITRSKSHTKGVLR